MHDGDNRQPRVGGVVHVHGRHSSSSGSNGIPLMTKLIEDLTLAGADKAAVSVHGHTRRVGVSLYFWV